MPHVPLLSSRHEASTQNPPIADLPQQATRGPSSQPYHPHPTSEPSLPQNPSTILKRKVSAAHSTPTSLFKPETTMTTLQTAHDIPLQISSENASAERRITPSWSVAQLKTKLEPVTGIPPSSQRLTLKLPGQEGVPIEAEDEERVQLGRWPLQPYAEIQVRLREGGIVAFGSSRKINLLMADSSPCSLRICRSNLTGGSHILAFPSNPDVTLDDRRSDCYR
jgi:hypothetical protein